MRNLFNRQFDMLVHVLGFYKKYAHLFSPDSLAGKMFAIIATSLPQLSESAGSQAAGAALTREGTTSRGQARAVLFDCLDRISWTARAIARDNPQIRDKFIMPYSLGDREVIHKAHGFAENAESMKGVFLDHEVDPDFIEELNAAITRFEESIVEHGRARRTLTKATMTWRNCRRSHTSPSLI